MLIPENSLREWLDTDLAIEVIADTLTMGGVEVEGFIDFAKGLENVFVGKVISVKKHPGADKLNICKVLTDVELQIVCGDSSVREEMLVACAKEGAKLPGEFLIRKTKIRGVLSEGMLCSESELGLSKKSDGIMEINRSFEKNVGLSFCKALNLDGKVLIVKPTPNRADCFSIRGIAKDLAALCSKDITFTNPTWFRKFASPFKNNETCSNEFSGLSGKVCSAFFSVCITNLNNSFETPQWITDALKKIGQKTISPLVDISNYFMFVLGRPSHIFDLDKINLPPNGLEVRYGKENEEVTLLNDDSYKNLKDVLVIADLKGPVAMAGIMGGKSTMVDKDTKNVLIEAAAWIPSVIRGRARKLGLNSEASTRFEKGVDPETLQADMEVLCNCIQKTLGGEIGKPNFKSYIEDFRKQINFCVHKCNDVLGTKIFKDDIRKIFTDLGCIVIESISGDDRFEVSPPLSRFDIEIEEDLIEEVARVYGYNRIEPTFPNGLITPHRGNLRDILESIRDTLVNFSFTEAINFGFIDKESASNYLPLLFKGTELVKLVNPISKNMDTMRPSQLPGLLKNLVENFRNQRNRINLFEIGNVFYNRNITLGQKPVTSEREVLSIISFGSRFSEQWGSETKNVDFFDLKNLLSVLLPNCKLELIAFSNENNILHPTRSAEILNVKEDNPESDSSPRSVDLRKIGVIGELHPVLYKKLNLPFAPVVLEIDLENLVLTSDVSYNLISKVPFVRRDLAFLMDKDIKVGPFLEKVFRELKNKNNAEMVKEIYPYDVYEGEDLPAGKKSITFRVILQEFGKTLEEVVVDDLINSLVDIAKNNYDTQLRG